MGDVTHLLDMSGNAVVKYTYDSHGNHTVADVSGGAVVSATHIGQLNPFRYRGYYYDIETKLCFLKTRYYDPAVGRFISQDGVSYLNGNAVNGLNLYAYCGDNPVMRTDTNGTDWNDFVNWVKGGVSSAWNNFTGAVSNTWNSFTGAVSGTWNNFTGTMTNAWNGFTGALSNAWSGITNFAINTWNGIVSSAMSAWNEVTGLIMSGFGRINLTVGFGKNAIGMFDRVGMHRGGIVVPEFDTEWSHHGRNKFQWWTGLIAIIGGGIALVGVILCLTGVLAPIGIWLLIIGLIIFFIAGGLAGMENSASD
jgi:RHS repeat-associated protein